MPNCAGHGNVAGWIAKLRAIKQIEGLSANFEPSALAHRDATRETHIDLIERGSAAEIAAGIAPGARRGDREGCGIEPLRSVLSLPAGVR